MEDFFANCPLAFLGCLLALTPLEPFGLDLDFARDAGLLALEDPGLML